ncbi:double-stranded RNA-binding protein 2-like [Mangifera indica]|uniref:double-stranded RNA-binding protein 2-like n=1 Tax=Mangifera indica TaxID=29780 RepID=UPI001CFBE0E2|nr:double-stranded RNA-binding protein 2-like [Mangifera indica]
MYKNQLQELAQRSCFNLPAYSCIREGPDHAPRFKATVNFSGETFESPTFCSTLRQAEHAAAEVALSTLANRGPSKALAARVLDETGVYKNLLQETAHKAGLNLPVYTTVRSGPGHVPVFSCTVKLAGMSFTGNPARTKKQAQKNAALAAWSTLKRLSQHGSTVSTSSSSPFLESKCNDEQEQVVIARFLSSLQQSESKHFMQIDRQHGHQRFIPMCRGLTPPSSSLYPEQCQSWAYPSFSPELALCQVWQQEQLLQLQSHLLTLPVSPTPQLGPQILPYMQSIFHPSHPLCIPTRKQPLPVEGPRLTVATSSSSLCFSSKSVPEPIRSRSTVTIQEIKEEKTEKSSKFPPSVVPDASVSVSTNAESRIEQPIQEDANKNIVDLESKTSVKLESKFRNVQYGGSQSELASHRNLDSGFRLDNLCIQNPQSASNLRQQYHPRASSHRSSRPPSSAAAHTSMRTVGPISSVRPHPQNLASQMPAPPRMRTRVSSCSSVPSTERMNLRQVHPNFMAPAVRIRTVVPVCSAPPPRQMPSSIQEATVLNREKKDAVQEDASTAASELDNLHL